MARATQPLGKAVPGTDTTSWQSRGRAIAPELARFGTVGTIGFLTDVGGFNLLRFAGGEGPLYDYPLTAKVVSGVAATIVAWLGHRYWTFRRSRRAAAHHEFLLFALVALLGTGIALSCLWISHYGLGLRSPLADNVSANGAGLVLGTAFRFWAYRTHVFSEHREGRGGAGSPVAPRGPEDASAD